jgi:hypothetical protein
MFVRSQQTRKLYLLQNQPFGETPGAAAPLVLEVDPMLPRTRMPKGLPEHREIVAIWAEPNNMLDTDPLGIAAPKPVRDAQRVPLALAPAAQKALIPAAWCQLIPDEGGYAARVADAKPSRSVTARDALPPISGHGIRYLRCSATGRDDGRTGATLAARPQQQRLGHRLLCNGCACCPSTRNQ